MTDQDYIRKAVELADGFHLNEPINDDFYHEFGPTQYEFISTDIEKPDQYLLDALAAQLVRQVDAHSDYSGVRVHPLFAEVVVDKPMRNWVVTDSGRTMNTIKAIVDSKVLE